MIREGPWRRRQGAADALIVAIFNRGTKTHALDPCAQVLGAPRGQRPRIYPHPGNLRRQAAVLDLRTAGHDNFETSLLGEPGSLVVSYRQLHPDDLRLWLERQSLLDDGQDVFRRTENVDHVD